MAVEPSRHGPYWPAGFHGLRRMPARKNTCSSWRRVAFDRRESAPIENDVIAELPNHGGDAPVRGTRGGSEPTRPTFREPATERGSACRIQGTGHRCAKRQQPRGTCQVANPRAAWNQWVSPVYWLLPASAEEVSGTRCSRTRHRRSARRRFRDAVVLMNYRD